MSSVFVTRKIPQNGIDELKKNGLDIDVSNEDRPLKKEELINILSNKKYDAVLCLLNDKIDSDVFNASPQTKMYANYAVGFDNIDLEEARKRGIIITNTSSSSTESVAEHTFALILSLSKKIIPADKFVRAGKYFGWDPMIFWGSDLAGKTLGVIGCGRIGSRVAEIGCFGFSMNIIYFDVSQNASLEKEVGARRADKIEDLLKESDFVSLNVSLNQDTKHLIDSKKLAVMKKTACIINTSRGPVIDELALVEALKHGVIAGAALDVFEFEPRLSDGLNQMENVVLTPHIASATEKSRLSMAEMAAKNIVQFFKGQRPDNTLN